LYELQIGHATSFLSCGTYLRVPGCEHGVGVVVVPALPALLLVF